MDIKRIAHRGLSSEAPENTRVSFALAAEGAFYGVECDIWKTKDGEYVVSHDGHLLRMCGVDKKIPEMTYAEVRSYPVTSGKKRGNYPMQYLIPFREYLSIMTRNETIHPVIELKVDYTTVELGEIVSLVEEYRLWERTIFISMYPAVLLRLKAEYNFPAERLQYVYGVPREIKFRPVGMELEQWLIENRINLDTRYTLIRKGTVMRLHEAGLEINVWTVNSVEEFRRMTEELGVDYVTSNYYFQ